MTVDIGGRTYRYEAQVREQDGVRKSFDSLAQEVFGISFEAWYQAGYWTDLYHPHVLLEGNEVVACVAASKMNFCCGAQELHYLQIGTVMTHPRCRGRGLSRWLMEHVLERYRGAFDTVYLFANDSAVGFYPKFGFEPAAEIQYIGSVVPNVGQETAKRRLNMADAADRMLLFDRAQQPGQFHAFSMCGGACLVMFYCAGPMREDCYYLPEFDAVVVAQFEGETMHCCDVFGGQGHDLVKILRACAQPQTRTAVLGFTPKDTADFTAQPLREEDTTLFVMDGGKTLLEQYGLRFPVLSHA